MWRGRVVRPHSRLVYYTAMHVQRLGQRRWYYLCWSIQLPQYNAIAVCVPPLVCSVVWRRALLSFLVLWKQFSLIPGEVLFLVLFFWKKTLFKSLLKQILFADDSVNRFYLNEDWICVKHETSFLVPINSDWFAWCAGHCCGFTIIAPLQEDEEPGRWFPQITGYEVRACLLFLQRRRNFRDFLSSLSSTPMTVRSAAARPMTASYNLRSRRDSRPPPGDSSLDQSAASNESDLTSFPNATLPERAHHSSGYYPEFPPPHASSAIDLTSSYARDHERILHARVNVNAEIQHQYNRLQVLRLERRRLELRLQQLRERRSGASNADTSPAAEHSYLRTFASALRQTSPPRPSSPRRFTGLCAGDWRIAALGEESQWQWCWCRCRIGLFTCRTLIVLLLPPLSMTQCPRCNPSPPGPIHWQLTPRGHRTRKVVQHHLRQAVLTTTLWNPIYGTLPFLRSSTSTVQPWIQERLYFGSSKEQSFLRLVSCEMFLR